MMRSFFLVVCILILGSLGALTVVLLGKLIHGKKRK